VQNPWTVFFLRFAFRQAARHLYANAQHGFCHFHVLALQERLGVFGKVQDNQRTLVLSPAQLDSAVRQFNNFQKGRWHKSLFSTKGRDYISHLPGLAVDLARFLYGWMNGA
jgi:hypothetical protein